MIHVTFLRSQGRLVGFDCTGHADYAEAGQDIVCSAVSALTQTAVLGLVEVAHIPAGYSISEDGSLHWRHRQGYDRCAGRRGSTVAEYAFSRVARR